MSTTKTEVLNSFIREKVRGAIYQEVAHRVGSNPAKAQLLMEVCESICTQAAFEIANDAYGRMQLQDILKWKIRRAHWGNK